MIKHQKVVAKSVRVTLLVNHVVGGAHKKGLSSQLNGLNHISVMTKDINKTLDFYVNKLGGYFIDDIQPSHLQSKYTYPSCHLHMRTTFQHVLSLAIRQR